MNLRTTLLAASCMGTFMVSAVPVAAQEASSDTVTTDDTMTGYGTIIVTARKREENLQEVPFSISALTDEQIVRRGIDGAAAVAENVPGLTFDIGLVPSDTRIAIRGLQATRGRPNVAILVDGVDSSSENFGVAGGGLLANLRLVDVERIEVVKGPQTVLYGRSAFAGAVNYITKRPGDEWEVSGSAELAEFSTYELKGAIGGPIGDSTIGIRLNGTYYTTDGDYDNPNTGGDLNAAEVWGGAVALSHSGDTFNAYARIQYSDEKYSERAAVLLRSVDPTSGAVRTQDGGVLLPDLRPGAFASVYSLVGDVSQSETYQNASIGLGGDPNAGGAPYPGTTIETWRATLEMTKEFDGGFELTSLTGYTDSEGHTNEDFDHVSYMLQPNTPIPAYEIGGPFSTLSIFQNMFGWPLPFLPAYGLSGEFDTRSNIEQFSQELRLAYDTDRTHLLLDALYWREEAIYRDSSLFWLREGGNQLLAQFISASQGGQFIPPFSFFHLLSPPETSPNPQRITRTTDSYSIAASAEFDVTDKLTLGAEARVIKDKIRYTGFNFDPSRVNTYGVINAENMPSEFTSNSLSFTKFTPRVTASWNNDNGLVLFANWARGAKPGGVDTTDQNGNVTDGVFRPEKVDAFEAGGKFTSSDGRFILNGALFYSIYKDQQIGVIDTSGPIAISATENIGESISKGVELETQFSPIDQIFLRAAYAYTDSEYTDYISPRCSAVDSGETGTPNCDFDGNKLPFTPKHALNASARFEQEVGADADLWIEAAWRYESKRFFSASNQFWLPSYTQTDLRAGVDFGRFSISGYVENLFKNDAPRSGTSTVDYGYFDLNSFNLPRAALVALAPKQRIGVRVGFEF